MVSSALQPPGPPDEIHGAPSLALVLQLMRFPEKPPEADLSVSTSVEHLAVDLLVRNRLLGRVTAVLERHGLVSPRTQDVVKAVAQGTTRMNGENLLLMRQVAALMARATFPVVFYKGPLLQQLAYGNYFERPSSDIDLLVGPKDYDAAGRILEDAGFRCSTTTKTLWWRHFLAEQQFSQGRESLNIDLHHRVQQPGCPLPRRPERLVKQSQTQILAGQPVLTLSLRHTILVAAMSLAKALHHREPAGRYVADVHALTARQSNQEWQDLWSEARLQGLHNTLTLALRSASAVFGSSAPPDPILSEVTESDLQQMLLDPDRVVKWVRRRRLLSALCDRPLDVFGSWLLMAAGEAARLASTGPRGGSA